jgi:hypothetical protein
MSTVLQPRSWADENLAVSDYFYLASSAFYGETIAGTWKVHFYDHEADGNNAYIDIVGLQFYYR